MEADRSTKRRNPLSDRTNTLNSSSPISINLIKPKPKPKSKPPSSTSSKPRLNKPSSRASSTNAATNLQSTSSNPAVAPPPPSSPITSSPPVTYSRRSAPNKRKDKGKALAFPDISTPILKLSDTRPKTDDGKSANLPKAKALTVPLRKKQRTTSSEDMLKDSELQDYIEKQKAYFKMIDEFELMEEEVETDDEPDEVEKTQSKCN
ncbi:pectinesterase inhibitor 10-like isoform X4 [Arachis ipaensis]|uniref:pectinesterase inhibitor 10-like isoform X4 n=1 Tax=Arachis ipaensis TaxID=130454 RepID=UPI0007AFD471|nr:pectinesterase inhibitor 10-like isoform X4 [Arachis ipaensis]XP_025667258.1 enhancer of mRNA-decapping protein 1 isoform X4 [Arachis hypogaea]